MENHFEKLSHDAINTKRITELSINKAISLINIESRMFEGSPINKYFNTEESDLISQFLEYKSKHDYSRAFKLTLLNVPPHISSKDYYSKFKRVLHNFNYPETTIWQGNGYEIGRIKPRETQKYRLYPQNTWKHLGSSMLYICSDGLLRCSRPSDFFPVIDTEHVGFDFVNKYNSLPVDLNAYTVEGVGSMPSSDLIETIHGAKEINIETGYNESVHSDMGSLGGSIINEWHNATLKDTLERKV